MVAKAKEYELWYQDKFNDSHLVATFQKIDELKLCIPTLPKRDYYIVEVQENRQRHSIDVIDYLISHQNEESGSIYG